jgi:hypothetical protein
MQGSRASQLFCGCSTCASGLLSTHEQGWEPAWWDWHARAISRSMTILNGVFRRAQTERGRQPVHREHQCRMLPFDASVGVHGTGSENSLRGTGVAVLVRWLGSRAGSATERVGRLHSPAPGTALRGSPASVARRTAVGLAHVPIEVARPPSERTMSGPSESLMSQAAPQGAHEHALRHAWRRSRHPCSFRKVRPRERKSAFVRKRPPPRLGPPPLKK